MKHTKEQAEKEFEKSPISDVYDNPEMIAPLKHGYIRGFQRGCELSENNVEELVEALRAVQSIEDYEMNEHLQTTIADEFPEVFFKVHQALSKTERSEG